MASFRLIFKNLKSHISNAIKESCTRTDARVYNIANEIQNIVSLRTMDNYNLEAGVDTSQDLSRIVDKTIKDSVGLGCDLSIINKGILIGAFRAWPFVPTEVHKTIQIVVHDILQSVFKYNGDVKQTIEGVMTATYIIAVEFNINVQKALNVAQEDILSSAKELDPKFAEDIKNALPKLDGQ